MGIEMPGVFVTVEKIAIEDSEYTEDSDTEEEPVKLVDVVKDILDETTGTEEIVDEIDVDSGTELEVTEVAGAVSQA